MKLFNWFTKLCFSGLLFFVIVCMQLTQNKRMVKHQKKKSTYDFNIIYSENISVVSFDHTRDSIVFFHIQKTSGTYWIDEIKKI
jgi:hypothetical protein